MTKQEVLLEIKEFRKAFNKIDSDKFDFANFVSKFDVMSYCGTVCCLWGWLPQIAPEIAEKYNLSYNYSYITKLSESPYVLDWPHQIRGYLFYPNKIFLHFKYLESWEQLSDVLAAWDNIIDTLENTTTLDYLF